jgi:hypothetical protein
VSEAITGIGASGFDELVDDAALAKAVSERAVVPVSALAETPVEKPGSAAAAAGSRHADVHAMRARRRRITAG